MNIVIANDHAAVELKITLMNWMTTQGHTVIDMGVGADQKADYPLMVQKAVEEFRQKNCHYGVLCCGTGIGISITANKIMGIRCALPQNIFAARAAREHNNCQFIALGSRISYGEDEREILSAFLSARFSGGRHERRIKIISDIENAGRAGNS